MYLAKELTRYQRTAIHIYMYIYPISNLACFLANLICTLVGLGFSQPIVTPGVYILRLVLLYDSSVIVRDDKTFEFYITLWTTVAVRVCVCRNLTGRKSR